jgi:hypothetical protein
MVATNGSNLEQTSPQQYYRRCRQFSVLLVIGHARDQSWQKRFAYTVGADNTLVLDVYNDAPLHSARPTLATSTFQSISEINAGEVHWSIP